MNEIEKLNDAFLAALKNLELAQHNLNEARKNISNANDNLQAAVLKHGELLVSECRLLNNSFQYFVRPIINLSEFEPKVLFLVWRPNRAEPFEFALSAGHFREPIPDIAAKIVHFVDHFQIARYPFP